jgi:hypothetical protein
MGCKIEETENAVKDWLMIKDGTALPKSADPRDFFYR